MMGIQCKDVDSLRNFLELVSGDTKDWTRDGFAKPWFRGVTNAVTHKLVPSVFRGDYKKREFQLTKKFRLMAPGFGATPDTGRIDQWLFLMQHHRVPTRLLDWTESPLIAAFFAAEKAAQTDDVENDAAIFGLDPIAMNKESGPDFDFFPNTWTDNSTTQRIQFAFGTDADRVCIISHREGPLELPHAIYASNVHSRISSQRSCFTLHGTDDKDFGSIFEGKSLITNRRLIKYRIPAGKVPNMLRDLSDLGITYGAVFPDLDGLARELRYSFDIKG